MLYNCTAEDGEMLITGTLSPSADYTRYFLTNVATSFVMSAIVLVGVVGNSAVIAVTFIDEALKDDEGNYFLVYQSGTDIANAVCVLFPSLVAVACDYWPFGEAMCLFQFFWLNMCIYSTSVGLAIISFDRALKVAFPLRYKTIMSKKAVSAFCAFNFTLCFCLSTVMTFNISSAYYYPDATCRTDLTHKPKKSVINIILSFGFYLPLSVFSICYSVIIVIARKSRNNIHPVVGVYRESVNLKAARKRVEKSIKSMLIVALLFYLSFIPVVVTFHFEANTAVDYPQLFDILRILILHTSSAINPFIYALLRKDYCHAFKQLASKF